VPLIASRIALPENLAVVPMLDVLPPDDAARYAAPSPALLRSSCVVASLNWTRPLRAPRVAGSRAEYIQLIGRMVREGMVGFTGDPAAVNGVFAVAKDAASDRLIIDAQPANRLFVDSPPVQLPNPSHLVQLHVPRGTPMYVAKTDLSNFYHHFGLPAWMQRYFALPPLSPDELASIGVPPGRAYPMCLTLPMGFSHAVHIAQTAHLHILYRGPSPALDPADNLVSMLAPTVTAARATHGVVIDDFVLFCLCRELAERVVARVLAAYRAAGFVVKQSKVVAPTSAVVKVIGFNICGADGTIRLPADSLYELVRCTLTALQATTVTGRYLAHVIGQWTWLLMLRRPTLAVLQHVYRFCRVAQQRHFTLWPSVRRELHTLLALLPLVDADLSQPYFHRAIASDASDLAAGVVTTALTPELHDRLWPLCSSRHHALQQASLNAQRLRDGLPSCLPTADAPAVLHAFDTFYHAVRSVPWRTVVSKAWSSAEHINALELRSALLAAHHAAFYPSSHLSRVYLLLDSTVAFFTLWKGRSSSPALLLILRKLSALQLASGITLLPGWLPSSVNPADAPSRLIADPRPPGSLAA
jgi:hypothetical protein